ncbi:MAG TPA: carboxypeptidase regulatory-like domain-containing protein [Candidatus Ozemobacteraceae bacterium]|nr:carboxypeptidase regulatory-like domain-containing protein [Candidatus Ozemobacteraceae bacterium]
MYTLPCYARNGVFLFLMLCLALLPGCLGGGTGMRPSAESTSPEIAVRQALADWSASKRPLIAQIAGQVASPTLFFNDLSGSRWEFTVYEILYPSSIQAIVKTTLNDTKLPDGSVKLDFQMVLSSGRWIIENILIAEIPDIPANGISGYIKDASGNPIPGATVALTLDGVAAGSTTTNASGFYTLSTSSPGTYTVTVTKDSSVLLTQVVIIDQFVSTPLIVTATGIQGYIRDTATNQPVPNAAVALYQGTTRVNETLTDSTGYYFMTTPVSGTYTIVATKDGYEFLSQTVVIN